MLELDLSGLRAGLHPDGQYAVEVRNAKWIREPLLALLRAHNITLVLLAYYTMPAPAKLFAQVDPVTGSFGYVRFLGNHRQMDSLVKEARKQGTRDRDWGELVVDRTRETAECAEVGRQLLERQGHVYMYFNNHFAGFAPGSVELFARVCVGGRRNFFWHSKFYLLIFDAICVNIDE